MKKIFIKLNNEQTLEGQEGTLIKDFLKTTNGSLAKQAAAGKVDGQLVDLTQPLSSDCQLEILTFDSPEGVDILRHSASHIMAQAVQELFPQAKLAVCHSSS